MTTAFFQRQRLRPENIAKMKIERDLESTEKIYEALPQNTTRKVKTKVNDFSTRKGVMTSRTPRKRCPIRIFLVRQSDGIITGSKTLKIITRMTRSHAILLRIQEEVPSILANRENSKRITCSKYKGSHTARFTARFTKVHTQLTEIKRTCRS